MAAFIDELLQQIMRILRVMLFPVFLLLIIALFYYVLGFTSGEGSGEVYALKAFFPDAVGLKRGTPVQLAGVEIGQVAGLRLDSSRRGVVIDIEIASENKVPDDSKLRTDTSNMLGEMYLFFDYGKSENYYKPGQEIQGRPALGMNDMMQTASTVIGSAGMELHRLLIQVNELLGDEEIRQGLKMTISKLPQLIGEVQHLVDENRQPLTGILTQAGNLALRLESLAEKIEVQVDLVQEKQMVAELSSMVSVTSGTLQSIDSAAERVARVAEDGSALMKTVLGSERHLKNAMSAFSGLLGDLNEGKGTGGKLLKDPALYENLNELVLSSKKLVDLLENQPSSIIFGRRKEKSSPSLRENRQSADAISKTRLYLPGAFESD
ncbi:MAG: MCE family protein [Planctomycetes bacterium]|nr:MCE family protein [Planctomycetota bacterium]